MGKNYGLQTFEADQYKRSRDEQGRRQHGKCCQAVHISLFCDGTNNNEKNDTKKGQPTDIALQRFYVRTRAFMKVHWFS